MSNSGGTWSAQVDQALDRSMEEYRQNRGLSKSETVRQVLREGLDEEAGPWYLPTLENAAGVSPLLAVLLAGAFFSGYSNFALPAFLLALITIVTNWAVFKIKKNQAE